MEEPRLKVVDDLFIIDNVAIPGLRMPPEKHPNEVFPDEIQEAMRYYQHYARCCDTQNIKPLTPQEYLMMIVAKLGRTGELREKILASWQKFYGTRNMLKFFGATDEELDIMKVPTAEQEAIAMCLKGIAR